MGALTSKPYAFTSRPWELFSFDFSDFFDSISSSIRIEVRGFNVMRVLPKINYHLNDEWISDKIRFFYDAIYKQRLLFPMKRVFFRSIYFFNDYVRISWKVFVCVFFSFFFFKETFIDGVFGKFVDLRSLVTFKYFLNKLGSSRLAFCYECSFFSPNIRHLFLSNIFLNSFQDSDICLFVGVNPRYDAPIINLRIRNIVLLNFLLVAYIGCYVNLTYKFTFLGNVFSNVFLYFLEGKHKFCSYFNFALKPLLFIGNSFCHWVNYSFFSFSIFYCLFQSQLFRRDWFGLNLLNLNYNFISGLELGFFFDLYNFMNLFFFHKFSCLSRILYIFDNDELIYNSFFYDLVVYHGHHGDFSIHGADLIVPGVIPFEKLLCNFNLEGFFYSHSNCLSTFSLMRVDYDIFSFLCDYALKFFFVDFISMRLGFCFVWLLVFQNMYNLVCNNEFYLYDLISFLSYNFVFYIKIFSITPLRNIFVVYFNKEFFFLISFFFFFRLHFVLTQFFVDDFYISDNLSRASSTLAISSRRFLDLNFDYN